jgi:hypothetical protein
MVKQHQREEPEGLGLVRHELGKDSAEADGLVAELDSNERAFGRRVSLVEDEVRDRQNGREPLGQEFLWGDPVGDPGVADLALRSHQSLRHGLLAHQERASDLGRGQATQCPKSQRDASFHRERGVTTREDEAEPIVGDAAHVVLVSTQGFQLGEPLQGLGLSSKGPLPAQPVDGTVPGRGRDPGRRISGEALRGPLLQGYCEGLLYGFLGQVEVAQDPDEGRDRLPLLLPEQAVDDLTGGRGRYLCGVSNSMIGRTSIDPVPTDGIRDAASIA